MALLISNPTADSNEKIQHAAELLQKSSQAREVFKAVYSSGKAWKTIENIGEKVPTFNNKTKEAASRLVHEGIIPSKKEGIRVLYGKDGFYMSNKPKILRLAANIARLKAYPTKRNQSITVKVASNNVKFLTKPHAEQLYVDDVDSFEKVRKIKKGTARNLKRVAERTINHGICTVLSSGEKNDWGGEKNDIFGTVHLKGKRIASAFAIKGKATQGTLLPRKMGSNGDQVQRLFESAALVHFIVYHSPVSETIYDLMKSQAVYKSVLNGNKKIYYCVIDGDDLNRLVTAYPAEFSTKS